MSIKAHQWASQHKGLTRLEKTVLKEIANRYSDEKGRAWPSQNRIANDTGYHRSSICRGLNGLEKKGLIVRINAFDSETGARTSNRYFLPTFDPTRVPRSKAPIKVESYWDPHGSFVSEESQVTFETLPSQKSIEATAGTMFQNDNVL